MGRPRQPVVDGPIALQVDNLGVEYNLRFTKKTKLRTSFVNILHREKGDRKFWALRSASFTVRRGESIGVIGPNGAGKSTLLLVLAGIITPSEGQVEVDGHISTLLSLSAGFDQELSGYDNIALAGALMGIPHETVQQITPEVVEFADIGAFIDAPLKTYSSGMRARLGFAIATAVDPDILLLDEVLQTGDEVFREKSRQRIISILTAAKAVVLVTHDMTWVTEFCTRADPHRGRPGDPRRQPRGGRPDPPRPLGGTARGHGGSRSSGCVAGRSPSPRPRHGGWRSPRRRASAAPGSDHAGAHAPGAVEPVPDAARRRTPGTGRAGHPG